MEDNNMTTRKKKKTMMAVVAVCSVAVVLFLCIFSLYHLPTRNPVETPEMVEDPNYVASPAGDFEETNDIMSASSEQVSEMLGNLEMEYQNAMVNNETYVAEQAGMRLALAYWKAGEVKQAEELTNTLINNFSYDEAFVKKCHEMQKIIASPAQSQPQN